MLFSFRGCRATHQLALPRQSLRELRVTRGAVEECVARAAVHALEPARECDRHGHPATIHTTHFGNSYQRLAMQKCHVCAPSDANLTFEPVRPGRFFHRAFSETKTKTMQFVASM